MLEEGEGEGGEEEGVEGEVEDERAVPVGGRRGRRRHPSLLSSEASECDEREGGRRNRREKLLLRCPLAC